ncbi:MAG TPA: SRPBCC family protein [Actinomycetota bacterium]|nr:SRPBCC family protein [Actinomycetota bacterium]
MARLVERQRAGLMPAAEFSVEVDATPKRVWKVVSDPRNIPAWERHVVRVDVPDDVVLGVGSTWSVEMSFMGVGVRVRGEIEEWEPPSRGRVRLRGPLDATIVTTVASLPRGHSVLRHEVTYTFRGVLGRAVAAGLGALGGAQLGIKRGTLAQKRQIERSA